MTDRRAILIHGLLIFAGTFTMTLLAVRGTALAGGYVPSAPISVPYFLTLFFLGTLALLVALRITKRGVIFEILFTIAMLSGAWFLADIFLPEPWALLAGSALILARFRWKRVLVANAVMVVGIAGIAASIAPALAVNAILIVFTVLAFYDIVAVYSTKHMVTMFRDLASRGVILAFVLTPGCHLLGEAADPKLQGRMMVLGTGDVALPAMLAASAFRINPAHGIAAALGAMAGFLLMFFLFTHQGRRRPMPALPPIALGSIVFYLGSLLIFPA